MNSRPPQVPFRERTSPAETPIRAQSAYASLSSQSDDTAHHRAGSSNNGTTAGGGGIAPARSNDGSSLRGARSALPARAQSGGLQGLHHHNSLAAAGGGGHGDIEALLSRWGASSTDVTNDFAMGGNIRNGWLSSSPGNTAFDFGGLDSLRIDRSASFDDAGSIEDNIHNNNNNNNNNIESQDSDLHSIGSKHRRIASTGGNRIAIDSHAILETLDSAILDGDGSNHPFGDSINHSALHDAARITDWPSVLHLSQSQPQSARYVGPDGWNALHHACDRRCPHVDVIDSLLTAHPEALVQTNDKGWTPLHRACRNKTPRDVVRLLLRKYPELGKRAAKMRCNDGRSSLHYALLYDAPEGVVDLLLQADPGAVLDEDRDGVSPLGTVWDKYASSFDGRRNLQLLLRAFEGEGWELGAGGGNDGNSNVQEAQRELGRRSERKVAEKRAQEAVATSGRLRQLQEKWNKADTLLRAYFRFPLQDEKTEGGSTSPGKTRSNSSPSKPRASPETVVVAAPTSRKRKWRILHAAAAIKCHPSLFLLARALHPEQAQEVDENDLYGGGRDVVTSSSTTDSERQQRTSQRTALHFAATSPLSGREGRNVIKVLIKLNPHAASHVDGYGSLPLHLICQNDRKLHYGNDGARDVYNANTEATSYRDGCGRTPLHCATLLSGHGRSSPPATLPVAAHQAISNHAPPEAAEQSVVRNLVAVDGSAASVADDAGRLPLHNIAERGEDWNFEAQFVLEAHPAAVRTRAGPSASSRLPLHMAASSPDARPSLIMNLVQANPRAASLTDGAGKLPLHLAVDSGRTLWDRGIDSIYEAYHAAISTPEDSARRWTVLHAAAASHSAGREVIDRILEMTDNAAASVADGEGRYPLHLACAATHRPWEEGGVRAIFDADPQVALAEDAGGLLPFHVAAMRRSVPTTPPSATRRASIDTDVNVSFHSETIGGVTRNDHADNDDDLESLEVLFNLLIAQPSILQF